MAKYSTELFDEIIEEMMRDKKTIMEMMAELDVDESAIYSAQTRIAKRQQTKAISDIQKAGGQPKKVVAAVEAKAEGGEKKKGKK